LAEREALRAQIQRLEEKVDALTRAPQRPRR
jgi:hypothetical protein